MDFENEVRQLGTWLKINKEKVTGDWLKRVNWCAIYWFFRGAFSISVLLARSKPRKGNGESIARLLQCDWKSDQSMRNFYAGGRQIGLRIGHHVQ